MSPTAAFWIGFVAGDVVASIAILFVLALLHAGKRGDEIGAVPRGTPLHGRAGRKPPLPSGRV